MNDDFEICDLDIDFEPRWLKRMHGFGRTLCYAPAMMYEFLAIGVLVLYEKIRGF